MGDDQDQVEARTPWGSLTAHGKTVIIVVCIIALAALELYIENDRKRDADRDSDEHRAIAVQLKINNYLISLPIDDRPRLIAPPELWPMLEREPQNKPDQLRYPFGSSRKNRGE